MHSLVVHCKRESYDVYVGRGSKWGNPYPVGDDRTREEAIFLFKRYFRENDELILALPELRGKTLGCYCAPKDCHGDFLALIANAQELFRTQDEEAEIAAAKAQDLQPFIRCNDCQTVTLLRRIDDLWVCDKCLLEREAETKKEYKVVGADGRGSGYINPSAKRMT